MRTVVGAGSKSGCTIRRRGCLNYRTLSLLHIQPRGPIRLRPTELIYQQHGRTLLTIPALSHTVSSDILVSYSGGSVSAHRGFWEHSHIREESGNVETYSSVSRYRHIFRCDYGCAWPVGPDSGSSGAGRVGVVSTDYHQVRLYHYRLRHAYARHRHKCSLQALPP